VSEATTPPTVRSDPPPRVLVELAAAGFRYDGDVALEQVDLTVLRGERLAVLGPNGGGKTTLLRLLLGLRRPSSGRVRWPGARPRRGYVPQFPAFERSFPVRVEEMVRDGLLAERRRGPSGSAAERARVAPMLERLDLVALRDAYLTELSGGELKRALLARALVGRPELLVLDEPAASLDEPSRRELWRLVAELPATATVVLATHDLAPDTFRPDRAVMVDRRLEELEISALHGEPLVCGHGHD
jgi:zinc transport system ATP-binding protein